MKTTTKKALKFKTDCILIEFTVSPVLDSNLSKKLWKEFNKASWKAKGIKIHEILELSSGTVFSVHFKSATNLAGNLTKIQSFINKHYTGGI